MFSLIFFIFYLQWIPARVISYFGVFFLDLKLDTLVTVTFLQSSKRKSKRAALSRRPGVSQSLLCVTSNPHGIVGIQNRLRAKKKKHDHCFLISCLEIAQKFMWRQSNQSGQITRALDWSFIISFTVHFILPHLVSYSKTAVEPDLFIGENRSNT